MGITKILFVYRKAGNWSQVTSIFVVMGTKGVALPAGYKTAGKLLANRSTHWNRLDLVNRSIH